GRGPMPPPPSAQVGGERLEALAATSEQRPLVGGQGHRLGRPGPGDIVPGLYRSLVGLIGERLPLAVLPEEHEAQPFGLGLETLSAAAVTGPPPPNEQKEQTRCGPPPIDRCLPATGPAGLHFVIIK